MSKNAVDAFRTRLRPNSRTPLANARRRARSPQPLAHGGGFFIARKPVPLIVRPQEWIRCN